MANVYNKIIFGLSNILIFKFLANHLAVLNSAMFVGFLMAMAAVMPTVTNAYLPARDRFPQVISHRGASGYVPEHSLVGYQLAMDLNTDYIEPDLVISKDGQFVIMHDVTLDDTTNVGDMPEFADRYVTKRVDGQNKTGWFVNDFTLAELKTLRLQQRVHTRSSLLDNLLEIPTFAEIMELAQSSYASTNRTTGIYAELKVCILMLFGLCMYVYVMYV